MAGHFGSDHNAAAGKDASGTRAPWSTPRVITSDLGDARANTIIPGGDFTFGSYQYGS